jgi:3',5'-cyclic AMP phosphodiesterase CpdA
LTPFGPESQPSVKHQSLLSYPKADAFQSAMLTILQISDLHFGPPYAPAVGQALLRSAARLAADVIVASGDFTQRAKAQQFAAARAFLDRLPRVPLVVVPGNHDVPLYRVFERLFSPYGHYRRHISAELDSVVSLDEAVIVALNTTSPLLTITNGRVRQSQIDFCAAAFEMAPAGALRIVVAHHHFAPAPDYDHEDDSMWGAKKALLAFDRMDVDMILGGHLHRTYIGNSLDVYPTDNRASGIVIVQCGTTTSRRGRARERGRNSFIVARVDSAAMHVTQFMYFDQIDDFAPVGRHEYPRRTRKWLEHAQSDAGQG